MWIIKDGSIFERPRKFISSRSSIFDKLFKCSLCLGFWSGVLVGLFSYFLINPQINLLLLPLASSAVCWLFDSVLDLIQVAAAFFDKNT
jgi:uncharacterized membrane protein